MINKYQQEQLDKRNKNIVKDKKSGKYSNMELAVKYHLTYTRILSILKQEEDNK